MEADDDAKGSIQTTVCGLASCCEAATPPTPTPFTISNQLTASAHRTLDHITLGHHMLDDHMLYHQISEALVV